LSTTIIALTGKNLPKLDAIRAEMARRALGVFCEMPEFRGANLAVQSYRGGELMLAGPAECLAGETLILDPVTGKQETIKVLAERRTAITVLTVYGARRAEPPFKKGVAPLYRVEMQSGKSFLATARHRVLTANGWGFVEGLASGDVLPLSFRALWCPIRTFAL
jgi:hypothetical protein